LDRKFLHRELQTIKLVQNREEEKL